MTAGIPLGPAAWSLVALLMAAAATDWLIVLAGLMVYALAMLYAVRPMLRRYTPNLAGALLLLLASSWATEALGVHALFGAFVAGLAMLRGLRTNIALASGARMWIYCALIIAVAISGKLFGRAFTLRTRELSWRESLTAGTLVNTRGLIELVILNIGLEQKIISPLLSIMNPAALASVRR